MAAPARASVRRLTENRQCLGWNRWVSESHGSCGCPGVRFRPDHMARSESAVSVLEARTSSRVSKLAVAGFVGPVLFSALVIWQGLLNPTYSHVSMPISALEAWPTGWVQRVNFWVIGVL